MAEFPTPTHGPVAHLGEHLFCMQGAACSSHARSTFWATRRARIGLQNRFCRVRVPGCLPMESERGRSTARLEAGASLKACLSSSPLSSLEDEPGMDRAPS